MIGSALVAAVSIIRVISPGSTGEDLSARVSRFESVVRQNRSRDMGGKNQDYQQGYNIGGYLAQDGESYDFKDLDQLANELYEEVPWHELPVENLEVFKDGLAAGYTFQSQ